MSEFSYKAYISPNNSRLLLGLIGCALCFILFQVIAFRNSSVLIDAFAWSVTVAVSALILKKSAPKVANLFLLIAVLLWLCITMGIGIFAFLIWASSAWLIGRLLLSKVNGCYSSKGDTVESILIGVVVVNAVFSLMTHFPVNSRSVYVLFFVIPVLAVCFKVVINMGKLVHHLFSDVNRWTASIKFSLWVLGLIAISWSLRWANYPTIGYDENANHLRLWTELLITEKFSFDIQSHVGSATPFAVNLLHSILSILAGEDARSGMNFGLSMFMFLMMVRIFQIWKILPYQQWLLLILMASTPILGNLLLTMQTELTLAVLTLAATTLTILSRNDHKYTHVLGVLAAASLCAAVKFPGVVLGTLLLSSFILAVGPRRIIINICQFCSRPLLIIFLILLIVGGCHSYFWSWMISDNPILPFYNAFFRSPYFPFENFEDTRWIHGFSIYSFVRAFFFTSQFFEAGDYTAGWQYLILLPLTLITVSLPRIPKPPGYVFVIIPLLGFGVIMFHATQYWRYLFPVMPLAGVLFAVLYVYRNKLLEYTILTLLIFCIVLNYIFFTRVSWTMRSAPSLSFSDEGKQELTRKYAPIKLLTARISDLLPGARVLYPLETPYGASLKGEPVYINWYSPARAKNFQGLTDEAAVGAFIKKENIDVVIFDYSNVANDNSPVALLRRYLARYGVVYANEGSFVAYKLSPDPIGYSNIVELGWDSRLEVQHKFDRVATSDPKLISSFSVSNVRQIQYNAEYVCKSQTGYFIAQVNWNIGPPYYRLVSCQVGLNSFIEIAPIPHGASEGFVYITSRGSDDIEVRQLKIGVESSFLAR